MSLYSSLTRVFTFLDNRFSSPTHHRVAQAILDTAEAPATYPYISPPSRETGDAASDVDGLFQSSISDDELQELCERTGPARAITHDFIDDALDQGFSVFSDTLDVTDKVLPLYSSLIRSSLSQALKLARLYGFSGLLCYYELGSSDFDTPLPTQPGDLFHLEPIPKSWVDELLFKKDADDRLLLPRTLLAYKMSTTSSIPRIDASRLQHIVNFGSDVLSPTGESALKSVFDGLTIYKHNLWGAGQTMWRSGNQLVSIIAPPDAEQWMLDRIDTALLNLTTKSAFALPHGSSVNTHPASSLDPKAFQELALWDISAGSRIPQKILMGVQKGALVGSQTDLQIYYSTISSFQSSTIQPVLTALLARLQTTKQLTVAGPLRIQWASPATTTDTERLAQVNMSAKTAKIKAETAKLLADLPATEPETTPEVTTLPKPTT